MAWIPPFTTVLREVTEQNEYETKTMADHNYKMPEKDRVMIEEKIN